jgi:hemoglobin
MLNSYDAIGGTEAVVRLVERFYDRMDQCEPALAALHPLEDGKVSRRARDRFASFFVGWLGGPDDYVKQNGHPRLRLRHARVPVSSEMRDAWLRCMYGAMTDCAVPADAEGFLRARLAEVAEFLQNVEE